MTQFSITATNKDVLVLSEKGCISISKYHQPKDLPTKHEGNKNSIQRNIKKFRNKAKRHTEKKEI